MNKKFIDLTGKVFGKLKVIGLHAPHSDKTHSSLWDVQCPCGTVFTKYASNLVRGKGMGCDSCYRAHRKLRPYEALYNTLVSLSRGRVPLRISYKQFLKFTDIKQCFYCEEKINWQPFKVNGYKLDRKDNALGYTPDNCVVCCPRCNRAKSDHFTYSEWLQIGKLIRSWKK